MNSTISGGCAPTRSAISSSPAACRRSSSRPGGCSGSSGRFMSRRQPARPPAPCFQRIEKAYQSVPDPFMSKHFLAVLILILACMSGPSPAEDATAHFDGDLQRLAEILGTLHYLRGICGTNEGPKWRNQMQALIDAETPSGDRRARMIAGFNRGYNGFQQTYRTCTPAATVAIRRYIEEGSKISRDLTARYAN